MSIQAARPIVYPGVSQISQCQLYQKEQVSLRIPDKQTQARLKRMIIRLGRGLADSWWWLTEQSGSWCAWEDVKKSSQARLEKFIKQPPWRRGIRTIPAAYTQLAGRFHSTRTIMKLNAVKGTKTFNADFMPYHTIGYGTGLWWMRQQKPCISTRFDNVLEWKKLKKRHTLLGVVFTARTKQGISRYRLAKWSDTLQPEQSSWLFKLRVKSEYNPLSTIVMLAMLLNGILVFIQVNN